MLYTAEKRKIFRLLTFACEQWRCKLKKASTPWIYQLLFTTILCTFSQISAATSPSTAGSISAQLESTAQSRSEGLTKQQGNAILQELRAIRQLLQKQQAAAKPQKKRPTSARIQLSERPSLGEADAPVTLVEFTDYQCPYCKRFHDNTFPKLKEKYIDTGKLRYIAMDLPLRFHQQAKPAARAAHCAAEQDKFWEMRKTLFRHPRALGQEELLSYAKELSLEISTFQECLKSDRYNAEIQQDIQTAHKAGFTGTPSFVIGKNINNYVNGAALIGAKSMAEFENHIQRFLPKSDGG